MATKNEYPRGGTLPGRITETRGRNESPQGEIRRPKKEQSRDEGERANGRFKKTRENGERTREAEGKKLGHNRVIKGSGRSRTPVEKCHMKFVG